jgi:hypothetical protein
VFESAALAGGVALVVSAPYDGTTGAGLVSALARMRNSTARYVVVWCTENACSRALVAGRASLMTGPQFQWLLTDDVDLSVAGELWRGI